MKLGEFLTNQFALVGVKVEDEHLGELLKDEAIFKAEIDNELVAKISNGLFTKDAAVNNPEIRKELKTAFIAQSLGSVDDKLKGHSNTHLPDFWDETLEKTEGTYNKIDVFVEKIIEKHKTELEEAKKNSKNPADIAKLQEEIESLNGQLRTVKDEQMPREEHQRVVDDYEAQLDSHARNSLFAGYNWANDKIDAATNQKMASAFYNEYLSSNELKLARENGSIKLLTKDGSEYFVDNKKITPNALADKLMAEHGFLANSPDVEPPTVSTSVQASPQPDATEASARADELASQFETQTV